MSFLLLKSPEIFLAKLYDSSLRHPASVVNFYKGPFFLKLRSTFHINFICSLQAKEEKKSISLV